MHIALVFDGCVPPIGYGGIERVVYWLAREMTRQGHQVTAIVDGASQISHLLPQVRLVDINNARKSAVSELDAVDIFHFHNEVYPEIHRGAAFLVTEHGNNKRKQEYSRNTVFLSRSHARNHNAEYFLPNGIPLEEYPLETDKKNEIAFLAKLNWRAKNARTAINLAFDSRCPIRLSGGWLKDSRKAWGFWLFKYPFLKQLIHEHGNVDGVEKLRMLQQAMCLFYLVNWHEPFALAPHEALACGTPVLATPNGALGEYIQDGVNGFLVSSYRDALDAINQLKSMRDSERETMAHSCRQSAYNIEDSVNKHLEMYRKVQQEGFLYTESEARKIGFINPPAITVTR